MKREQNLLSALFLLWNVVLFPQVGIGTYEPHEKSILDISSENGNLGVLFPRLTTTQINSISPANDDMVVDGLWVYNTDTKCYNYWASAPQNQWLELCGTSNKLAIYTCMSAVANGMYTVETSLTNANNIVVSLLVTTPGKIQLVSEDKNGIKFDSGELIVTVPSATVTLYPVASSTKLFSIVGDSVPNSSEEVSLGNNGTNNQYGTYAITNTKTGSNLSCSATFDVKPKIISTPSTLNMTYSLSSSNYYWPSNNALWATQGNYSAVLPTDSRITMDMSARSNWTLSSAEYWNSAIRAKVAITSWQAYIESSADINYNGTNPVGASGGAMSIGDRLGSFDTAYFTGATMVPTYTSGIYGVMGIGPSFTELDTAGINLLIDGKYYKYRLIYDGQSGSKLAMSMVLYGVYSNNPAVYKPSVSYSANGSGGDRNAQSYWP